MVHMPHSHVQRKPVNHMSVGTGQLARSPAFPRRYMGHKPGRFVTRSAFGASSPPAGISKSS
jgi:hypothetical protein